MQNTVVTNQGTFATKSYITTIKEKIAKQQQLVQATVSTNRVGHKLYFY